MNSEPTAEKPSYSRDQVIAAFKPFVDQGIAHPDELPLDNPSVIQANAILDAWSDKFAASAEANPAPDSLGKYTFSRNTIFVDAGFSDADYLSEVANDWLSDDLQDAEQSGFADLAARIQAKRDEINSRLQD